VRLQSRSFARLNQSLRRSFKPNRASLRLSTRRERENFNDAVFALAFFSQRQIRDLLGAISRGLLDCHFDFKAHRLRDGFSASNAIVLKGSVFYVGNLDGFL
jgi:hypothetical protein